MRFASGLATLGLLCGWALVFAAVLGPLWLAFEVLLGGGLPVDGVDWCGLDSDATPQSEPGCE